MPLMTVTANRLSDGAVIYRTKDRSWSREFADGALLNGTDAADDALEEAHRDVERCLIVAPYLIELAVEDGASKPRGRREQIRARGPSI